MEQHSLYSGSCNSVFAFSYHCNFRKIIFIKKYVSSIEYQQLFEEILILMEALSKQVKQ